MAGKYQIKLKREEGERKIIARDSGGRGVVKNYEEYLKVCDVDETLRSGAEVRFNQLGVSGGVSG